MTEAQIKEYLGEFYVEITDDQLIVEEKDIDDEWASIQEYRKNK